MRKNANKQAPIMIFILKRKFPSLIFKKNISPDSSKAYFVRKLGPINNNLIENTLYYRVDWHDVVSRKQSVLSLFPIDFWSSFTLISINMGRAGDGTTYMHTNNGTDIKILRIAIVPAPPGWHLFPS